MGIQCEASLTNILKNFQMSEFAHLWAFTYVYTVWRKDDDVRFRAFS